MPQPWNHTCPTCKQLPDNPCTENNRPLALKLGKQVHWDEEYVIKQQLYITEVYHETRMQLAINEKLKTLDGQLKLDDACWACAQNLHKHIKEACYLIGNMALPEDTTLDPKSKMMPRYLGPKIMEKRPKKEEASP